MSYFDNGNEPYLTDEHDQESFLKHVETAAFTSSERLGNIQLVRTVVKGQYAELFDGTSVITFNLSKQIYFKGGANGFLKLSDINGISIQDIFENIEEFGGYKTFNILEMNSYLMILSEYIINSNPQVRSDIIIKLIATDTMNIFYEQRYEYSEAYPGVTPEFVVVTGVDFILAAVKNLETKLK